MGFPNKFEKIVTTNKENKEHKNSSFSDFLFDGIRYNIKNISSSRDVAKKLGLEIKNDVPIYYIEGSGGLRKGAYDSKNNVIFMFDNADEITLKHEIIHSLEFNKAIPDELNKFYEFVKNMVTEKSFDGGTVTFNFKKNIHEFIADGYSKQLFINALKKEGIYDNFLERTKYIFE